MGETSSIRWGGGGGGGFLAQMGSRIKNRVQQKIAEVHSTCPQQAAQCDVPAPGVDLASMGFNNIRNTMQCLRQSGCDVPLVRLMKRIQSFMSGNGGGGDFGGNMDYNNYNNQRQGFTGSWGNGRQQRFDRSNPNQNRQQWG